LATLDCACLSQGFSGLLQPLSDGVFLCWLVQSLSGAMVTGVNRKPLTAAHRAANIARAIAALRTVPNMSRRCVRGWDHVYFVSYSPVKNHLDGSHIFVCCYCP
jgi:hypothetical protein